MRVHCSIVRFYCIRSTQTTEDLILKLKSLASGSISSARRRNLTEIHARLIRSTASLDTYNCSLLIRCYTNLRLGFYALHLYRFISRASLLPDSYILPVTLKAISQLAEEAFPSLVFASQLQSIATRICLLSHPHCESAFVAVYCDLGRHDLALRLFDQSPQQSLGSWNALIAGFSRIAPEKALPLFLAMRKRGFHPDDVTMVAVNSACSRLGDFSLALQLHKLSFQITRNLNRPDHIVVMLQNSVIHMYCKCARMDLACKVFASIPHKNVSAWTSIIVGYARLGHDDKAINFFRHMVEIAHVIPNYVTFIGVLTACAHRGKVSEGRHYFNLMTEVYGITPRLQHYGCMVDLLGRAGLLQEARELIEKMPMKPNAVIYGCLMGACEKYGDADMGEWLASRLMELQPWNDGALVVLSNIFAANGLWSKVENIRKTLLQRQMGKYTASSISMPTDR